MDISYISSIKGMGTLSGFESTAPSKSSQELSDFVGNGTKPAEANKTAEVAQKFEAILTRQILSESMKPLLESGPSGQVYGYLITDALADAIGKGGGLGLSPILENQLKQ